MPGCLLGLTKLATLQAGTVNAFVQLDQLLGAVRNPIDPGIYKDALSFQFSLQGMTKHELTIQQLNLKCSHTDKHKVIVLFFCKKQSASITMCSCYGQR